MTSSPGQHLASYPATAAGSARWPPTCATTTARASTPAPYERPRRAQRDARRSARAEQGEPLCTCNAFHRPHPHHGPVAAGAEPAGDGSAWDAAYEHDWKCVSPQHGPDAIYRCRCGQTAPGSEIGVTEQARDWFYAPAGRAAGPGDHASPAAGTPPSQLGRRAGARPAPARRRVPVGGHRSR